MQRCLARAAVHIQGWVLEEAGAGQAGLCSLDQLPTASEMVQALEDTLERT